MLSTHLLSKNLLLNVYCKQRASSAQIHPIDEDEATTKIEIKPKEEEERDQWTGKLDFFLSALSYSVGLGAVWRL